MPSTKRWIVDDGWLAVKRNATRNHAIRPQDTMMTRSNSAGLARHAVFFTTELLERIFMHLQFKDVFVCQMVCCHFRDIIANSVLLRRMMFLEIPEDHTTNIQLCPLLDRSENELSRFGHLSKVTPAPEGTFHGYLNTRLPFNEHASWRKMYAAVPPVQVKSIESVQWEIQGRTGREGRCEYHGRPTPRGLASSDLLLGDILCSLIYKSWEGKVNEVECWTAAGLRRFREGSSTPVVALRKMEKLLEGEGNTRLERGIITLGDPFFATAESDSGARIYKADTWLKVK